MDLPRKLGPYRLLKRLGHGGMAEVYLALAFGASGFEKKVALKVVLPQYQGEGTFERILIEEAKLAAQLCHRNLVGVHDLGVDQGAYYVRMDYIDGADLATLLARSLPSPALALWIVSEVAEALGYVHRFADERGRQLGLVHRDVSPQNVLISRAGEVKLADFGIAKATLLVDPNKSTVRKGKFAYMSPEQVASEPLTPRSDLFGLGVTLYELLTARRPYEGTSPADTLERIKQANLPPMDGIDPLIGSLLTRLLARRPEERFEDTAALVQTLAAVRRTLPQAGSAELAEWVSS
jgi:serine/threonine-protein kinase